MDTLEEEFSIVGHDLLFLGGPQSSNQSLKDIGTPVITEEGPKSHSHLPISIFNQIGKYKQQYK